MLDLIRYNKKQVSLHNRRLFTDKLVRAQCQTAMGSVLAVSKAACKRAVKSFCSPVIFADRGIVTQSKFTIWVHQAARSGLVARLAVAAVASLALTGCGFSSLTSGLGGGVFQSKSKKTEVQSVTAESMLSAAKGNDSAISSGSIAGGCPRFVVWPRDNSLTIYEPGKSGDGLAIMHRGEITKTARECQIEPGRVTVKYGFSGRVLLGPRGQSGTVRLPLNVFVTDAKREKIKTDTMSVDVPVAVEKPIGYFSTVRSVTFEIKQGTRPADYRLFVGFDRNAKGAG